jgi:hypothetical protein
VKVETPSISSSLFLCPLFYRNSKGKNYRIICSDLWYLLTGFFVFGTPDFSMNLLTGFFAFIVPDFSLDY